MRIKNEEKQILLKYYAERIKSSASNLKELIQQDKQDILNKTLENIDAAGLRICELQSDFLEDLEQELKDQGQTATAEDVAMTGGKIYG